MKRNVFTIVVMLLFSVLVYAGCSDNDEKNVDQASALQKLANISPEQAQKLALNQAAGKIAEGGLELENGLLVYSYDIQTPDNRIMEVQINAKDGSVVITEEESKAKEKMEAEKEGAEMEQGERGDKEHELQRENEEKEISENENQEEHEYKHEEKGEHEKGEVEKQEEGENEKEEVEKGETGEQGHKIVGTISITGKKGLQSLAKISKQQAKAAALKIVEGKAEKVELENEDGYLVYKVEVEFQEIDYEVLVDAGTGKVLGIEVE